MGQETGVDLIIKGGTVISHEGTYEADVLIDKGKIVAVSQDYQLPQSNKTIDARGKWVMPGLVDCHDHLGIYIPGTYERQMREETAAALCGGVTTIGAILNDVPYIDSYIERISEYIDPIERSSYCNAFVAPTLGDEKHLPEIKEMVKMGVTNFKFFLHKDLSYAMSGTQGGQPGFTFGIKGADDGYLWEGMTLVREYDSLSRIHAENVQIGYRLTSRYAGNPDPSSWPDSKPAFAEEIDILKVCAFAQHLNTSVYIVHVGHCRGDQIIRDYRDKRTKVFAEAQIFHLLFDQSGDNCVYGPRGIKTNPPVRGKEWVEYYWQWLAEDFFDTIATDMAAAEKQMKLGTDLWTATTGSNMTEVWLPAMVKEGVQKRGIPIEKIVKLCSYNPARISGIFPEKGIIQTGSDADIVIFDPKKKVKLSLDMLHTGINYNLLEGWEFEGWPVCTILGGKVAVEDGKIFVKPGVGKYLRCKHLSERKI